jgi:hypothetical protein
LSGETSGEKNPWSVGISRIQGFCELMDTAEFADCTSREEMRKLCVWVSGLFVAWPYCYLSVHKDPVGETLVAR